MNLLVPTALALGVTLPIVVIFYLLQVRRHDEEISSTFLWNDLIRDLGRVRLLLIGGVVVVPTVVSSMVHSSSIFKTPAPARIPPAATMATTSTTAATSWLKSKHGE